MMAFPKLLKAHMGVCFMGIATVSLLDVDAAVEELERAVNDLGLLGVRCFQT